MTDLQIPREIELLLKEATNAYELAAVAYADLEEEIRDENRRRLEEVHEVLRVLGQGRCYTCGNYRPIGDLKLFYEPRNIYNYPAKTVPKPSNVFPACKACQANSSKVNPRWALAARIKDGVFQAKDRESGRWKPALVRADLKADDTIYFPRGRVTPRMALEFGVLETLRFHPRLRMPPGPPVVTAFPKRRDSTT
ncbi:MAG TPA: hypothetical protein VLF21_01900 [Candidatus Saccharimonadales bacterium]|nr:hypothetical protein [Candidatus Saccharimonadales bacterium]